MKNKILTYVKSILKTIVLYLIESIESYEYKNIDLDENDPSKKIIDTILLHSNYDFYIETDTGYSKISHIHKTQPFKIIELKTESNKKIKCADLHILFDDNMQEVFCSNLKIGDKIQTKNGPEKIVSVIKYNNKVSMFDATVDDNNHRYWTNDILSHNTITVGMFIAWYICFNFDKNVLVLANKQITTIEIIDKIKNIIKNLPFFLQPGVVSGGKTGLTFDNDNRIFSQSTTKSAAIGFTVHLLFADEFAHIHANFINDFYRSIYPTLSSSKVSKIIICSTPNGMNLFYRLYNGAEKGQNSYIPLKVDWWEVPGRDETWKAREIANLGSEEMFEQEFGNKFIVSTGTILDVKTTEFFAKIVKEYVWKELDYIDLEEEEYQDLKWHPDFDPTDIYDDEKFVLTVDLADGVGKDYSVINIFKVEPLSIAMIRKMKSNDIVSEESFFRLRQVGKYSSNEAPLPIFTKIFKSVIFQVFNPEIISVVIEMNFKGTYVVEKIKEEDEFYPEFFIHTYHNIKAKLKKIGIIMGDENKQLFCRKHKDRTKHRQVIVTETDTFDELQTFSLNQKGKYQSKGTNDDSAVTAILTEAYFDSANFEEDIGELMDNLDQSVKNVIYDRIDNLDIDEYESELDLLKSLNN